MIWHFLVLVPVSFLVMFAFSAPQASDAKGVIRSAVPKAIRLIVGTAILVVLMQVFPALV